MKTLVNIVTALTLAGGIGSALAQTIRPFVVNPSAFNGAAVGGINSFNESYLNDGNNYSIEDLCLLNPMACPPPGPIIGEDNPFYPDINIQPTPPKVYWKGEIDKLFPEVRTISMREIEELIKFSLKKYLAEGRPTPPEATPPSDSSDTEKELGSKISANKTYENTTNPTPQSSTPKDPCPEDLSLEQLRSYQLIEKRPPIERYLNKSGCIGSIVYNSAEERIIYHTSNNQLGTLNNITDTTGKTIFNGNFAGTVDAMEVTTTPSAGLFEYLPSFNGCASNMTISTSMAIGLGMGTLILSTPLVYLVVRRRRKVRMESTVYTSTRMGV